MAVNWGYADVYQEWEVGRQDAVGGVEKYLVIGVRGAKVKEGEEAGSVVVGEEGAVRFYFGACGFFCVFGDGKD